MTNLPQTREEFTQFALEFSYLEVSYASMYCDSDTDIEEEKKMTTVMRWMKYTLEKFPDLCEIEIKDCVPWGDVFVVLIAGVEIGGIIKREELDDNDGTELYSLSSSLRRMLKRMHKEKYETS